MKSYSDEELTEYIKGNLPSDLAKEIKNALDQDSDMKERIGFLTEVNLAVETRSLKTKLVAMDKDGVGHRDGAVKSNKEATTSGAKVMPLMRFVKIAAVMVGLLAVSWLFFQNYNDTKGIASLMELPVGLPTPMSTTNNYEFLEGMVQYKSKNYEAAEKRWTALSSSSIASDTLIYYLASSQFAQQKYNDAEKNFETIRARGFGKSKFDSNAYWYLALIAMKQKNYKKARTHLKFTEHPKKEELMKVIGELE